MNEDFFEESKTLDKLINNFSKEAKNHYKKVLDNCSQKLFNLSVEIDLLIKSNDKEVKKLDL